MLFLARFAARGRWQAAVAAAAISLTPLFVLSAALIALITMRRGVREGGIVLLWSMLPIAVVLGAELASPSSQALAAAAMLGCWLAAWTLRRLDSWSLALAGCTLFGLAATAAAPAVALADLSAVADAFNAMQARLAAADPAAAAARAPLSVADIEAALGATCGYFVALGAALGRHWQAALFNPGGFRREFHALRLPLSIALVATAGALWNAQATGGGYTSQMRVWLFVIPLLFAGLARVHRGVAGHRYAGGVLTAVYVVATLFPFARFALAGIGLADSLLGFVDRRRKEGES